MAEHASGCPDCSDLQQRIEGFDAPMVTGYDAEWNQTEKRLDNWLESFLASDAAVLHAGDRIGAPRLRVWWKGLTKPLAVRRLRWVVIPAGALALVICSFLVGRVSVRRSPQVSSEVVPLKQLPANVPPPSAVIEQRASGTKPTGKSQLSQAPRIRAKPSEGIAIASRAHVRTGPPAASPAAPQESARAPDTAALTPASPSASEVVSVSSPAETPAAPVSPDVRGERTAETAQASAEAPSVGPAAPRALASRRAALPGMTSLHGFAKVTGTRAEHSPAIPALPAITLDAGTRVWIALESVRPRGDGASEFRGRVLLPVTQSGAVLLSRNVEVSGTMAVRNGKRSVQITEFLSTGARYRLKGASGEADLRLLGAGEAVEFDAGRVVETWMASVSTYEKVPGESSPPGK